MGLLGSTTPITNTDIKNTDKVYLSKSSDGDIIKYSCSMKDFKDFLVKNVYKYDYEKYYTGTTPNIQRKLGFDIFDISEEFLDALRNEIYQNNCNSIYFGDILYLPITWNGVSNKLWQVVDINCGTSDSNLVFKSCSPMGSGISTYERIITDNNNSEDITFRWYTNDLQHKLRSLGGIIMNDYGGRLPVGSIYRTLPEQHYKRDINTGEITFLGGDFVSVPDQGFIPTESNIFGKNVVYSDPLEAQYNKQFKLFQLGSDKYYKDLSGIGYDQWTCSISRFGHPDDVLNGYKGIAIDSDGTRRIAALSAENLNIFPYFILGNSVNFDTI